MRNGLFYIWQREIDYKQAISVIKKTKDFTRRPTPLYKGIHEELKCMQVLETRTGSKEGA